MQIRSGLPLTVFLLEQVDFETALAVQRRTVFDVSGERDRAVLLLCEHAPVISVGREGSRTHIAIENDDLRVRSWPIRWLNRGGGCMLHVPGQLVVYAIVPLDRMGVNIPQYLDCLHAVLTDTARDCCIRSADRVAGRRGVWSSGRMLAQIGIGVRDGVTFFGAALNVNPDLEPFRRVHCDGHRVPMTSIDCERHVPVNPALARQRLVERFMEHFGMLDVRIQYEHPALPPTSVVPGLAPLADRADYFFRHAGMSTGVGV